MPSAREVRLRIRSIKSIAQVTRALQAVSASKVRKAQQAVLNTRPYASKAWQVLTHIADQPGRAALHPLLTRRAEVRSALVLVVTGDRGLAGAYTSNIMRFAWDHFDNFPVPVRFIAVGRKGRDLLLRRRKNVMAEFSNLPAAPAFADVSAIGRLAVEEFLLGNVDEVFLVYTDFINFVRQEPRIQKLLPLEVGGRRVEEFNQARSTAPGAAADQQSPAARKSAAAETGPAASYIYEPGQAEILDEIIPRFTALQVYHAVLESLASEHAARMVAMKNATDAATDLANGLQLEYNQVRQQAVTNEMLDIAGGAEALGK